MSQSNLVRVSGLWKNDGAKGTYLAGKINEAITIPAGARIMVFINEKRESDNHPTHSMVYAPPEDEQQRRDPVAIADDDDTPF